jgi:hypothetical protein
MPLLVKPTEQDPYYRLGDRAEPRVSRILGLLFESWMLPWREKVARQGAFRSHAAWRDLFARGDEQGAHRVARKAVVEDTTARDLGTEVHAACENWLRGNPRGTAERSEVQAFLDGFVAWFEGNELHPLHIEATIFGDGWAGTADLIYEDADGSVVLADIKTGRVGGAKQAMQLVGYGSGEFIANPDGSTSPMPHIDRYVILDLKPDHCRELELSPTAVKVALAGFRGLVALHRLLSHRPLWNKETP